MDREEYFKQKFGITKTPTHLLNAGESTGIKFNFCKRIPNTLNSHRLIHVAKSQNKQDEIVELLFKKYFEEGENIGSTQVLKDLAKQVKLEIVRI